MHTVVETPAFIAAARAAGLTDAEVGSIIDILAADATAGDVIPSTGGCRKVRIRGRGKGKSGGYRVITFYSGPSIPLFLLTVFRKGDRVDLTRGERNALAGVTRSIVAAYRGKRSE